MSPSLFPIFCVGLVFFVASLFWFHSYTGLGRDTAFLVLAGTLIAGACASIHRARSLQSFPLPFRESVLPMDDGEGIASVLAVGLIFPFTAALILRLWGRWIGTSATDAERQPGTEGIRAWFRAPNLTVGTFVVVCAWLGYDISPILGAMVVAAALAASPLLRLQSPAPAVPTNSPASAPTSGEDLSAEREKILSMLESGKLTPDESAELLQALGESSRRAPHVISLTGHQRLLLIGAALVTIGFFLPWYVINPARELNRLTQDSMHVTINGSEIPVPGNVSVPAMANTGDISVSGGEIQRGLGWAALFLALSAALIPYVATTLDTATTCTVRLLCVGLGALILLHLVTQHFRLVGVGLIIVFAGYAVEVVGALRERRHVAA